MDTQKMLDEIHKKYADKTLSLWCLYISEITKRTEIYDGDIWKNYIRAVVWHPISLARVLSALGDTYFFDKRIFQKIERDDDWYVINTGYICNRKLLNDDWRDVILEDQSDETIKAIYNILFPTT